MNILIGADPEVFIEKNGVPFSAHGLIPGTKKKPFQVPDGAVQVDGMAGEFNIVPAPTAKVFVHNVQSVLSRLESMLPSDCKIAIKASTHFSKAHMAEQPQEALELGCEPDYNAYTGVMNARPNGDTTMRTAAGHVHIGWTEDEDPLSSMHFNMCKELVTQLDYYLGIPSLYLDTDTERRALYGKAGAFRPKSYGVEYRVLSNFWLKSPELMEWVFSNTVKAVTSMMEGRSISKAMNGSEYARAVIDARMQHVEAWENYVSNYGKLRTSWIEDIRPTFQHLLPKKAA